MAEALGVATGVIALASAAIKTTRAVIEIINGIKDAPKHVTDLQYDVQSLHSTLTELEAAEKQRLADTAASNPSSGKDDKGKVVSDAGYDRIKDQLKHCKTVLKSVEDELRPVLEQMKGGKKQVVWASICVAFTEKTIKEHSSRLEKARSGLIFTMIIDIRSTVLLLAAAPPNTQSQGSTSPGPSSTANNDPPPEYPGPDPKMKRRDSNLLRDTLRHNSLINRFRSSETKANSNEEPAEPSSSTPKQFPTFSQVINSTMANMSKSVAGDKGDYSISTFKMIWENDLEQIQSLWNLEKDAVQDLKRTINDHMCEVFTSSLCANVSTMNEIKDAAEGTLGWIDTTTEYIQWRGPDDHKFLLLEGKAGSGKSVFTKTLCRTVTDQTSTPKTDESTAPVLLSYFCNKRVRAEDSCIEILKAFISQYLRKNKSEFTAVYKSCPPLSEQWDPINPANFDLSLNNVLEIFGAILQTCRRPVYCIIDAIDECHSDANTEELMKSLPALMKRNTNFRLFMSSRPDWVADNDLSAFNPVKITLHPSVTEKDISQVIELELCRLQSKLTIHDEDKEDLKRKLTSKAEGMMLWVILAFGRIHAQIKRKLSPTLEWLERSVEKLPQEIFRMYDYIMAGIRERYGRTPRSYNQTESSSEDEEGEEGSDLAIYGRLVLWVARAARPLTVKELQFALALDMRSTCLKDMRKKINYDIERVVGRIPFLEIISAERFAETPEDEGVEGWGEYVPRQASVPSSTVRFIHQSAREYILRSADSPTEKSPESFTYPKLDDATIGNLCVNFLSFKDFDDGPNIHLKFKEPIRFRDGIKKFVEECGFLEYSASYWGYHLNRASDLDESTKEHVADWITNRKNNLRLYFQVMNFATSNPFMEYVDGEFGLLAAAGLGIEWLTEYLIQKGHNLEARDEWGRTAFLIAENRGFDSCVEILTDAGANTRATSLRRSPRGIIYLRQVINGIEYDGYNHGEILGLMDEFGNTPLFYACAKGDSETLATVLEKNPDLKLKDQYGRLPIDFTLDLECRELLLDKMRKGGIKCTPAMLRRIPCPHGATYPYLAQGFLNNIYCDFCGWVMGNTIYYHCCGCSTEKEGFDVCKKCHDNGKRCLDSTHQLHGRVIANTLVSSLEYTPHMGTVAIESPMKWNDDDMDSDDEMVYEDGEDEDDESGDSGEDEDGITRAPARGRDTGSPGEKEKRAVRVQALEETGAGCCKCTVQ
ncbi:hypothetical protein TWF481_007705 [Arthrobotrys musiformis]|uniref:NACHT domain-containing protein n=1 Tax=Arthrobotrys musiformis TaxID=47236 RepID=A0AAV9WEI0_9PEZI